MKGHLKERSPGHWSIVLSVNEGGKRKLKWHSYKGNKRSAQIECARHQRNAERFVCCADEANLGAILRKVVAAYRAERFTADA